MRFLLIGLAAALGWLGCSSGTEVGNPEVSLRVSLIPAQGWEMFAFPVQVLGGSFQAGNGGGTVWDQSGGLFLDAADSNANSLPPQAVSSVSWDSAAIQLGFPASHQSPSDTTAWGEFKDSGWVPFRYNYDGKQQNFLFALPDSMRIALRFDANTLRGSVQSGSLRLNAWFDCRVWVTAMGSDSLTFRPGGSGGPFAVLSPTENAATYLRLLNTIPLSFRTTLP